MPERTKTDKDSHKIMNHIANSNTPSVEEQIIKEILVALEDDLVSFAELVGTIDEHTDGNINEYLVNILMKILTINVEIGHTVWIKPRDYVAFVAWRGGIEERVKRALKSTKYGSDEDRLFSVWLCRHNAIDEYES